MVDEFVTRKLNIALQQAAPEETYEVKMCVEEAAVIVTAEKDIKTTCTITLTSPIMREEAAAEGGTGLVVSSVTLWGKSLQWQPWPNT